MTESIISHVKKSVFIRANQLLLDVDRKVASNQFKSLFGLETGSPSGQKLQDPSGRGHPHSKLMDRVIWQSSDPSRVVEAMASHSEHVIAKSR